MKYKLNVGINYTFGNFNFFLISFFYLVSFSLFHFLFTIISLDFLQLNFFFYIKKVQWRGYKPIFTLSLKRWWVQFLNFKYFCFLLFPFFLNLNSNFVYLDLDDFFNLQGGFDHQYLSMFFLLQTIEVETFIIMRTTLTIKTKTK